MVDFKRLNRYNKKKQELLDAKSDEEVRTLLEDFPVKDVRMLLVDLLREVRALK